MKSNTTTRNAVDVAIEQLDAAIALLTELADHLNQPLRDARKHIDADLTRSV